jgi:hypothetical protein
LFSQLLAEQVFGGIFCEWVFKKVMSFERNYTPRVAGFKGREYAFSN